MWVVTSVMILDTFLDLLSPLDSSGNTVEKETKEVEEKLSDKDRMSFNIGRFEYVQASVGLLWISLYHCTGQK